MPGADLQITIGADASGVTKGVAEANSALADFAPRIDAVANSFSEFGLHLKEGFAGVEGLAKGLQLAGSDGAEGLAGLTEAGGGAAAAVTAVVQVALGPAAAMSEWATRTMESTTASAAAKQNAADLDTAMSAAGKAFGDVGDTIAGAFAPAVTALVGALAGLAEGFKRSYDQGGAAKNVVDLLVFAFKVLASGVDIAVGLIIAVVAQVRGQIVEWGDDFRTLKDGVIGGVGVLETEFKTFGQVLVDVLSGDFSKGVTDFNRGLQQMQDQARRTAAALTADQAVTGHDRAELAAGLVSDAARTVHAVRTEWSGPSAMVSPPVGTAESSHDGPAIRAGARPAPAQPAAASGQCPPSPCLAVATVDQQKLTETNARGIEERARDGQKSIAEQLSADKAVLAEKIAAVQTAAAAGQIGAEAASAEIADLRAQEVQKEHEAADAIYQRQSEALKTKLSLYAEGSKAYQAVLDQETNLTLQHNAQLARIEADAAKQRDDARRADLEKFRQEWDSAITPLATSFASGLLKMAEGAQSFGQLMAQIGDKIATAWVDNIARMVSEWARGIAAQVLAQSAGDQAKVASKAAAAKEGGAIDAVASLKEIVNAAATAFGKTYAAVSAIPVVGPFLAPAAAAGAFAAVIAFKGLVASAAGGFDIPAGVSPLTQLHAQEMVLPARLANPMRAMMDDYAATRGGPWAAASVPSGGDTHVHNYHVSAMDAGTFKSFLRGNKDPLSTVLQEMGRAGMKTA